MRRSLQTISSLAHTGFRGDGAMIVSTRAVRSAFPYFFGIVDELEERKIQRQLFLADAAMLSQP